MSLREPKTVILAASVLFSVGACSGSEVSSGGLPGLAGSSLGGSGLGGQTGMGAGALARGGAPLTNGGAINGASGSFIASGGSSLGGSGTVAAGGLPSGGFSGMTSNGGVSFPGGASSAGAGGSLSTGGSPSAGGAAGGGGKALGGTSVGGAAAGGTSSAGKASGGASSGGAAPGGGMSGTSGTIGTCPASCGSHKWACWKMPNPTGSGLPNPASYTSTTDVVHDNITCLDWQRTPSTATYTNAAALAYCEGLTLGGFDDWRGPTRIEHSSIVDWSRSTYVDAVFTSAGGYHKTASNWVLTANQQGAGKGTDFAWGFNMSDGISGNAYSAAGANRIRCVRGNGAGEGFSDPPVTPPNQYTAISADVAQDNYTGLIWQRDGAASGLMAWDAAVTYCGSLTLGSFDDWRLPSVRELATLVDEWLVAPSINRTMFPNTRYGARSNNWYWASHAQRGGSAHWALNFDDGFTGFNVGASGAWNYWTQAYVKCVR